MPSFGSDRGDVLYLVVCAAPPASETKRTVASLQASGWDVCVVATPAALAWIDVLALRGATGHSVRSEFRTPDDPEFVPRGDAVLVAPATFNTINKCAVGVNDSLALGLINEALGSPSIPLALVPWVNPSLSGHPAYRPSLLRLEAAGAYAVMPESHEGAAFNDALSAASRWLAATAGTTVPPVD
jgi:phosphopantothenoylcysteine synthetase/decarboxylase